MTRARLLPVAFTLIGIAIGAILSLQIRSNPIKNGSSALDELETRKSLLESFSLEQEELKKNLAEVEEKLQAARRVVEQRTSKETLQTFQRLRKVTGLDAISGEGIRITLLDNPNVVRTDFSSIDQHFVQAPDLRDLVNALYLKDAEAIAINGKRVTPLTPIQAVFDSILIGNLQVSPPFSIEAMGNPVELEEALHNMRKRKILMYVDTSVQLTLHATENFSSPKFLDLLPS